VLQVQDVAMKELAAQLVDSNSLLFFARGNNYATALEAALKVRCAASGFLVAASLSMMLEYYAAVAADQSRTVCHPSCF
jgi:hypothetical protein